MQGDETNEAVNRDCHTSAHGASCECVYNAQYDRRQAIARATAAEAQRDEALHQVHLMNMKLSAAHLERAVSATKYSASELLEMLEGRAKENETLRLACLREIAICQRQVGDNHSPSRIALGILAHVLHEANIGWPRIPL